MCLLLSAHGQVPALKAGFCRQIVLSSACAAFLFVFCVFSADAGIYSYTFNSSFANGGNIPDNNASGWTDARTISTGDANAISDISVKLNISGGFNGDLYAYISYGGVLVPLLNRVGVTSGNSFGYSDTGFNITLSDAGAHDVHSYGNFGPAFNGTGQLTGTWQADGRTISPLSSPGSFDGASRVAFSSYDGLTPDGSWTLFISDLSGGEVSHMVSWELDITTVPEPTNVAMALFAGLFAAAALAKRILNRKLASA